MVYSRTLIFPRFLGVRSPIPIWPFYVRCVFRAIGALSDVVGSAWRPALGCAVVATFIQSYAASYVSADLAPLPSGDIREGSKVPPPARSKRARCQ